jgi:hypothetical protein
VNSSFWTTLKQDWIMILPVSVCYALVLSFFEVLLFALLVMAADSTFGQSLQRVNPFLTLIGQRAAMLGLLLTSWPISVFLVLTSRSKVRK